MEKDIPGLKKLNPSDLESSIHWRQWSVGIILLLHLALIALVRFHLVLITYWIAGGSAGLILSLGLNIYLLLSSPPSKTPWGPAWADGLLIAGLVLLLGAFF